MSSLLSSIVDNLSAGLHNDRCIDCKSCLDYMTTEDEQLIFRCFECKKNCKKDFHKKLIKRFANIYEFSNEDNNKFILLLRKGVYPSEKRVAFSSSLDMEDSRVVDQRHEKTVFRNLGDFHDLYVQSDILLLGYVFEKFRNKCIEIYELDPAHFISAPGLAWQACLKKTETELELITNFTILLMVEQGIKGETCHAIHRYAKLNNKYMNNKIMIKMKNLCFLNI